MSWSETPWRPRGTARRGRPSSPGCKEYLRRIGDLKGEPHTKACCALIAHPSLGRYVKTDKKGQPRLDQAKVKAEEKLDGKYLLSTSDDTLSAEDVALATSNSTRWRMPSGPSRPRCH